MPSCPSCGKSIADGAGFCAYCGASATTPVATQPPGAAVQRTDADYWICGSCHAENLVGDAFCQTCGVARAAAGPPAASPPASSVPPTAAPFVGQGSAAYEVTCTSCGTANEPDASFCHACGLPLVAKTVSHATQPTWGTPSASPAASSNTRWIILAAVIVAVAAAAVIGIVLLAGRDDGGGEAAVVDETTATVDGSVTGSSDTTSDSTTTVSAPTERDVTGDVAVPRASSCLNQNQSEGITYVAWNLLDGDMATCWSEGVDGDGIGETVHFKFSQRMTLTRMEVMPGYKKYSEGVDRWRSNGRLREITVTFADGSQDSYSFSDSKTWQSCEFGERTGSTLEFTIDSIYYADTGTHHDADDTSVSEVRFYGWPASERGE